MPDINHRKPRSGDRVQGMNSGRWGVCASDRYGEKGDKVIRVLWDGDLEPTEIYISVLVVLR